MNSSLEVAERLKDYGIKPSFARIKIYDYLNSSKDHPTVDIIYNDLVKEMPTLSKTTVYNTLKIFVDADIVKAVNLDENEKRYDFNLHNHSHFLCEKCKYVYDIPIDDIEFLPEGYKNFKLKEKQILLKGICEKCSQ